MRIISLPTQTSITRLAKQLTLVRHGQIQANCDGHWHGSTDSPLNRTGRGQAKRVAKYLAARSHQTTAIYASPLQRCRKTAESIAKKLKLPVLIEQDLREYSIGVLEGTAFADLEREHSFYTKVKNDTEYAPENGDSIISVAKRIIPVLKRIHAQHSADEAVIIVSHGAAMAIAMAELVDSEASLWSDYLVENCSVTDLVLGTVPYLASYNHTAHL